MTTYSEKLKDPRWQKKRLKVLERDGWACQVCESKEMTLHVHHLKYVKSGNPWDSPLRDLQTLCEQCHGILKDMKEQIKTINKHLKVFHPGNLSTIERCCEIISGRKPAYFWDLIWRIHKTKDK